MQYKFAQLFSIISFFMPFAAVGGAQHLSYKGKPVGSEAVLFQSYQIIAMLNVLSCYHPSFSSKPYEPGAPVIVERTISLHACPKLGNFAIHYSYISFPRRINIAFCKLFYKAYVRFTIFFQSSDIKNRTYKHGLCPVSHGIVAYHCKKVVGCRVMPSGSFCNFYFGPDTVEPHVYVSIGWQAAYVNRSQSGKIIEKRHDFAELAIPIFPCVPGSFVKNSGCVIAKFKINSCASVIHARRHVKIIPQVFLFLKETPHDLHISIALLRSINLRNLESLFSIHDMPFVPIIIVPLSSR